jgi:hypothetical protein
MGGTILVISLAVIGSYVGKTQDNREVALKELAERARERGELEQTIITRVERQVRQCAEILERRLKSGAANSSPIPLLDDGTRRQLPHNKFPPIAVIVTGSAASDQQQIDAARCARDLLDELGGTLAEYPSNLTIAVPGKWMATWPSRRTQIFARVISAH